MLIIKKSIIFFPYLISIIQESIEIFSHCENVFSDLFSVELPTILKAIFCKKEARVYSN